MCLETRSLSLPHCEWSGVKYDDVALLAEDFVSSHLPPIYEDQGAPLRKMHADIYKALRGYTMCAAKGCRGVGPTGPDGKYYSRNHFSTTITPNAELPNVKFESGASPEKGSPSGITDLPDGIVLSLVHPMGKRGAAEGDLAQDLTVRYGRNAP